MRSRQIVAATERLYRALFTAALTFALGMAVWGAVLSPFNDFHDHRVRSIVMGLALAGLAGAGFWQRERLFGILRHRHAWLVAIALGGIAVLWADGGWHTSYYLLSFSAIGLSAVVAGVRWTFGLASLLAAGYLGGVLANGYSWAELEAMSITDSVLAKTGGYFIAAYITAVPIEWLGRYVSGINRFAREQNPGPRAEPQPHRMDRLNTRERQIVLLAADDLTSGEIAERLHLSPRTVEGYLASARRKVGVRSKVGLVRVAVEETLVPEGTAEEKEPAPGGPEGQFA